MVLPVPVCMSEVPHQLRFGYPRRRHERNHIFPVAGVVFQSFLAPVQLLVWAPGLNEGNLGGLVVAVTLLRILVPPDPV